MPSCSEQRLPASEGRRFNLLRAAQHLQDPRKASHLEYASPGWLCPQEPPCPWQNFASRNLRMLLFPTDSVSPAAKLLPWGEGRKALCPGCFIAVPSPAWGAGNATCLPAHAGTEHCMAGLCCRATSGPMGFGWLLMSSASFSQQEAADRRVTLAV